MLQRYWNFTGQDQCIRVYKGTKCVVETANETLNSLLQTSFHLLQLKDSFFFFLSPKHYKSCHEI